MIIQYGFGNPAKRKPMRKRNMRLKRNPAYVADKGNERDVYVFDGPAVIKRYKQLIARQKENLRESRKNKTLTPTSEKRIKLTIKNFENKIKEARNLRGQARMRAKIAKKDGAKVRLDRRILSPNEKLLKREAASKKKLEQSLTVRKRKATKKVAKKKTAKKKTAKKKAAKKRTAKKTAARKKTKMKKVRVPKYNLQNDLMGLDKGKTRTLNRKRKFKLSKKVGKKRKTKVFQAQTKVRVKALNPYRGNPMKQLKDKAVDLGKVALGGALHRAASVYVLPAASRLPGVGTLTGLPVVGPSSLHIILGAVLVAVADRVKALPEGVRTGLDFVGEGLLLASAVDVGVRGASATLPGAAMNGITVIPNQMNGIRVIPDGMQGIRQFPGTSPSQEGRNGDFGASNDANFGRDANFGEDDALEVEGVSLDNDLDMV